MAVVLEWAKSNLFYNESPFCRTQCQKQTQLMLWKLVFIWSATADVWSLLVRAFKCSIFSVVTSSFCLVNLFIIKTRLFTMFVASVFVLLSRNFVLSWLNLGVFFFFLKTWATLGGKLLLDRRKGTFMTCSRKIFDVYAYTSPMKFSEQCDWHTQMFVIQASLPDKDLSHLAVH